MIELGLVLIYQTPYGFFAPKIISLGLLIYLNKKDLGIMEAPLVNDYKRSFILRRLLETLLGGLRLYLPTDVPFYVYLFQIGLFSFVPIVIAVFLYLLKNELLEAYQISLSVGFSIFVYAITIQVTSICIQKQSLRKTEMEETVGDEEVFLFDSSFGPRTWHFLFPSKKNIISLFLHAAVAGLVSGLSVCYLHPGYKEELGLSDGVMLFLYFIGILSVGIGIWPLFVGCPPEPATFHQLPFELLSLSRSCHLLTCIVIHIISSFYPEVNWLFYTSCLGHLVFVCCPLLWLIGALPPIDAYVLWALEQWLVVVLGGSPAASNIKLFIQCFFGTGTLLLVSRLTSFSTFAVMLSVRGFFLSLDIDWLFLSLKPNSRVHETSTVSLCSPMEKTFNRRKTAIKELVFLAVLILAVIILSLGVHLSHQDWYDSSNNTANSTIEEFDYLDIPQISQPLTILWITLLLLASLLILAQSIQKPFVLILFRNPLYSCITKSKFLSDSFPSLCQLIHLGGPFVSLLFLHILIVQDAHEIRTDFSYLYAFLEAVPYGFTLRQIWQFPEQNLVILITFYTLQRIFEPLSDGFPDLSLVGKLHLFTLFLLWINGTLKRLRTIFVFSYTSVAEAKQRKLINFFLVGWNIATIILLVAIAVFSSIFSMPLFPLFTLPLFLIGFPRPLRFWPYPPGHSANICSDTIYYEQLAPYVARSMHYAAISGKLGIVQPGEIFLLRYEDRFFWIQVLECGFIYLTYSFKGLELQETSCHTAEASRVDSIFSRAFDLVSGYGCYNTFPLHCLTPLTRVTAIGYSDTRNILTGVIDSPDTLIVIKDYFLKALLYFLLEQASSTYELENLCSPRISSLTSRIGSAELKTRKVFSSLPKVERTNRSPTVDVFTPKSITNYNNYNTNINDMTPMANHNTSTPQSNLNDTGSLKSQSGRGSRLAWVTDSKIRNGESGKIYLDTEQSPHGDIVEEKNITVLRPMSWDDSENPTKHPKYETNLKAQKTGDVTAMSGNSVPSISSKAKSYVTSGENTSHKDLVASKAHLNFDYSSSDSEAENFYVNSISKKPDKPLHSEDPINFKQESFSKVKVKKELVRGEFKNILSLALTLPPSWVTDIPYEEELVEEVQDSFPLSWFKFLLKHFGLQILQQQKNSGKTQHNHRLMEIFLRDDTFEESYRTLVALCQITIFGHDADLITSNQVLKLFLGKVDTSPGFQWMTDRGVLFDVVLKCYRIAVKLSLDHTLVGPTNNSWVELLASLKEYDLDWYVGPDTEEKSAHRNDNNGSIADKPLSWNAAIRQEIPSLFSIGYNDVKGVYTSHMLTLGEAHINLGSMDRETVKAIWASLSGELMYLTNDDDERYSIQAHPVILRNLTVQAADPPLGYPIFSSPPVRMGLPWLYSH